MNARAMTVVALLLVVPLAGCIENMSDLKDRLQGSGSDPLPDLNSTLNGTTNGTVPGLTGKEPVARVDVYLKGGAKLHGSDFVAGDGKIEAPAVGGKEISFVGSGSEALDGNATIASYDWTFGDGKTAKGSTATHVYDAKGGVFQVALKVTDSKGRTDTQKLQIGVMAAPIVANVSAEGTIAAPSGGFRFPQFAPQSSAAVPFTISAMVDGMEVEHVSTTLTLAPGNNQAADMSLYVANETEQVAASEGSGPNEAISLDAAAAAGEYVATVWLDTGAQGAWVLTIVTTYQPVNHDVMEFFGGHGGGHQH